MTGKLRDLIKLLEDKTAKRAEMLELLTDALIAADDAGRGAPVTGVA